MNTEEPDEPRFLECVKMNFDKAAKYMVMQPGLLEVGKSMFHSYMRPREL